MELIVYAPIWGQSGYEQLSRGLLIALDKMGVGIELRIARDWNQERVQLPRETISRLIRMTTQRVSPLAPHLIYQLPKGQLITEKAPAICYSLFETDRFPQPWLHAMMSMDKILTFSEFNRTSWATSGIPDSKLGKLPVAVDSFTYTPDGPRMAIQNARGYIFLCSGDYTERKNFEAVIEAYVKEFSAEEEVTLIFKCHYGGFTKNFRRNCAAKLRKSVIGFNRKPPRILFWGDKISDHAMASLYRSVDCFVLTSRGEGLGMQYLEAMASGTPVIHCNWSAHTDYLDARNSYPVGYTLKVMDDPEYLIKCPQALNSKWAQVDVDDLRRAMRHVVGNREQTKRKTAFALNLAREQTWQKMAVALIGEIVNMFNPKLAIKESAAEEVSIGS